MTVELLMKLLSKCRPDDEVQVDTYEGETRPEGRLMVLTPVATEDDDGYQVNYFAWVTLLREGD